MPKGKGKGKKKGGGKKKGDKKAGAPPPPKAVEEKITEDSKQFYMTQIIDLEQRLARYQAKCDKLQLSNDQLEGKLSQQLEDQEQVITFLKRKSQEQTELNLDLEEKSMVLRQAKEKERERLEQQISQLKEDSQRALDQAAVENKVLQGQLESLENFRLNKEKLEAEMTRKDEVIEQQQREHEEALYQLEKKAVLDKDRMKKEMVAKVNSVASEFRKVSDLQMAETTKRTIRENVAINQQLGRMSDKTMELIQENESLRAREAELRRQVDILEASEREVTRRNVSNRKVLTMLTDRAQGQEQQLTTLQERVTLGERLGQEARLGQEQATTCRKEAELSQRQVQAMEREAAALKQQLAEASRELQRLRATIVRASHAIQAALQPVNSESDQLVQRESLLSTLLELLNLASQPHDPQSQPMPALRYQPGDLGIVPAKGQIRRSARTHPTELHSGGAGTQLPPLASAGSPLTGSRVR